MTEAAPAATEAPRPRAPRWVERVSRLNRALSEDFLGGPKVLKFAWVINAQKCTTVLFVGALMALSSNWSAAAWVYLGLHGAYGFVWLLKHVAFPDPSWEKRVTFGGALLSWLFVLGPYWVAPVLLVTDVLGHARPNPSAAELGVSVFVHTLGVAIMIAADAQKTFTLRLRRGLITDGMFARVRHPNYLGEMMIYGAYAFLVGHWIPWAILAVVWTQVFTTNMLMKEASMSRYPEWAAYKARTGMLLPRLFAPKPAR